MIVLISKLPSPIVAQTTLERAEACGKPVAVNSLGTDSHDLARPNITTATILTSAANITVALLNTQPLPAVEIGISCADLIMLQDACQRLSIHHQAIRNVFTGGTFCCEAQLICQQRGFSIAPNAPIAGDCALANIWQSEGRTLTDMDDDDFTRDEPRLVISPTLRNQRLLNELNNSHTTVVLFNLVLGYSTSMAPASELLDQLSHIDINNASLLIVHACGTEADPQICNQRIRALQNARIIIANSNAQAALWASTVAQAQSQKKGLNA